MVHIKKEPSPIDVDMLPSGNRDLPIYIDNDSTTSDEEVDAQVGEKVVSAHTTREDDEEEDTPTKETEEKDIKEEEYSSDLEYDEPPVESTPGDEAGAPALSEEPAVGRQELIRDTTRESTKQLSTEPPMSDKADIELQARKPTPPKIDEVDPAPSSKSPARSPIASSAADSSSPSPTPDPKTAALVDLLRPRTQLPKPKMKMPPATQPPPQTKKRPFAFVETPLVAQVPKPNLKRTDFLKVPASQPMSSITAPIRYSAGSTSAGASQRALTVESDESDTRVRKRKRIKASASPEVTLATPAMQQKPFRRPQKHEYHWHTDGSVILSFQGMGFRLHRSRLAQQSKFLADLFHDSTGIVKGGTDELKVKARRDGNMDGQPLFIIDGVAPDDFDRMLKATDNAM